MIITNILFPSTVVGVAIAIVSLIAHRRKWAARALFIDFPLVCALVAASGIAIWMLHSIGASKSSTAAIGYIFLPFFAIGAANAAFLVSWAVLYVVRFVMERFEYFSCKVATWHLLIPAILVLALAAYVVQHDVRRHLLLKAAASGEVAPASRESILASGVSSDDLDVLTALAKNSSTSGHDLIRIYDWAQTTVGRSKPFEYPIFHALAKNPSTPFKLFDVLSKSRESTIRLMVAQNQGTPKDVLLRLAGDSDQLVRNQAKTQLNKKGP